MSKSIIPILALFLAVASCGSSSKKNDATDAQSAAQPRQVTVPVFDADSAYSYVAAQTEFGPRVPGTEAHARCADYLVAKFKEFGAEVVTQDMELVRYDGVGIRGRNIIASYGGENRKRVMLCAHWDSRPWADNDADAANHHKHIDGANDGASGVGVLLEIARHLSQQSPAIGIDIVLFDAEDSGTPRFDNAAYDEESWCLGSQYWARAPHKSGYSARYAILLDMVGARDAVFYREGFSENYAHTVVDKIWKKAADLGYAALFVDEPCGYLTDDHVPVNQIARIPCVDIIHYDPNNEESGFGDFWHTVDDNIAIIDKSTLAKVGTVVLNVIYSEK